MNAFHGGCYRGYARRSLRTLPLLGRAPSPLGSLRDDSVAADELVSNWKLSFKTDLGLPVKAGFTVSAVSCSSRLISPAGGGGYFSGVILPSGYVAVATLCRVVYVVYSVDSVNATLPATITLTLIQNHSSTS